MLLLLHQEKPPSVNTTPDVIELLEVLNQASELDGDEIVSQDRRDRTNLINVTQQRNVKSGSFITLLLHSWMKNWGLIRNSKQKQTNLICKTCCYLIYQDVSVFT